MQFDHPQQSGFELMESLETARREEQLARRLIAHYGFQCDFSDVTSIEVIIVTSFGRAILYFSSWRAVLFGNHLTQSLNTCVKEMYAGVLLHKFMKLDYSSLDELDIKLTLAGANHE